MEAASPGGFTFGVSAGPAQPPPRQLWLQATAGQGVVESPFGLVQAVCQRPLVQVALTCLRLEARLLSMEARRWRAP